MLLFLIQLISMLILPEGIRAQETGDEGVKTIVTSHASDTLQSDTTKIVEDAPLDIGRIVAYLSLRQIKKCNLGF